MTLAKNNESSQSFNFLFTNKKISLEHVGSEELHINNLDLKTPITFFFFFSNNV